jgi:hypothetical protein
MMALAERLYPGMRTPKVLEKWLRETPVQPVRFIPMLKMRIKEVSR